MNNRRLIALVGATAIMAGAIVAVQIAGTLPAAAVPGLHKVSSVVEPNDSRSAKSATARCNAGEQVVGGGGWVDDFGANQVVLTQLQPFDGGTAPDGYAVSAQEPAAGFAGVWWLQAYALCASPLAGYTIVSASTASDSTTFKAGAAVCTNGRRVIGTGSRVNNAGGQVGLVLSRAAGPLDISRSSARERANGYSANWSLTSYAICANPIAGMHTEGTLVQSAGDDYRCTSGFVHHVGGGGGLIDTGPFFLTVLYPFNDLRSVQVFMTGMPVGGIAIQAICGP